MMELMPDAVETLAGEHPADLWKEAEEQAKRRLGEVRPIIFGGRGLKRFFRVLDRFTVTFRIVSAFYQLIRTFDVTFDIS